MVRNQSGALGTARPTYIGSSKEIAGFGKKAAANRIDIFVAQPGEFLELGFLDGVQMRRYFDSNAHVQIAVSVALDIFYPLAFDAKNGAILGARRDVDPCLRVERRHIDLCAEGGLHEADRDFADQIVAFAMKNFVRLDVKNHVKIPGRTAARARFAVAAGAQSRAGIDAGRNTDTNFRSLLALSAALASAAGIFNDAAGAVAAGAGLGDAEDSARADDLAPATTSGAGLDLRFAGSTRAMASLTLVEFSDRSLFFDAMSRFLEVGFHTVAKIAPTFGRGRIAASAAK